VLQILRMLSGTTIGELDNRLASQGNRKVNGFAIFAPLTGKAIEDYGAMLEGLMVGRAPIRRIGLMAVTCGARSLLKIHTYQYS
jgi:hypothetical protein